MFYIQFIGWLFSCLVLYIFGSHLNYYRGYSCDCFDRSNYFVCLWNDYYLISKFIDWFFTCLVLYVISLHMNFYRGYVFGIISEVITMYACEAVFIFYPVQRLIFYLIGSLCYFFSIHYLQACIIITLDKYQKTYPYKNLYKTI